MISPATSGEIFTSVSGWTLPVAETVWRMVLRTAFSVVIGIGFSRFDNKIETLMQAIGVYLDKRLKSERKPSAA